VVRLKKFYKNHILKYEKISFETLLKIKAAIAVFVGIIIFLVKLTNISIVTKDVFGRKDYKADFIYSAKNESTEDDVFSQEIMCLRIALKEIDKKLVFMDKKLVQAKISGILGAIGDKTRIAADFGNGSNTSDNTAAASNINIGANNSMERDLIANKVYYRILDYYTARMVNIKKYIFIILIFTFLPELILLIRSLRFKSESKKELALLKRLVILNGSIKPVDFNEVLESLIEKARFYRPDLENIKEKTIRNSVDNNDIYKPYMKKTKSISEKLFFEKLCEAQNYDFDQTIKNIAYEFKLDRREEARNVKKRIELIHVWGLVGLMAIIFVMILYLVMPWMRAYDLGNIGF